MRSLLISTYHCHVSDLPFLRGIPRVHLFHYKVVDTWCHTPSPNSWSECSLRKAETPRYPFSWKPTTIHKYSINKIATCVASSPSLSLMACSQLLLLLTPTGKLPLYTTTEVATTEEIISVPLVLDIKYRAKNMTPYLAFFMNMVLCVELIWVFLCSLKSLNCTSHMSSTNYLNGIFYVWVI